MLFDDEVEILEEDRKYPECYAVPIQKNFSIKDIWIPAHLLLNRLTALDSNRSRPNLFHTLSRPEVESFATYEDTEAKKNYVQLHSFDYNRSPGCTGNTFDSVCNNKEKSTSLDSVNVGKGSYVDNLQEHSCNTFLSEPQLCDVEANYYNQTDFTNSLEMVNKNKSEDFMGNCSSRELPIEYPQHMLQDPARSELQSNEIAIRSVDHNKNRSSNLLYSANQGQVDNLHEHCLNALSSETQLPSIKTNCSDRSDSTNFLEEIVDKEKTSEDSTTSSSFEVLENLPVAYQKQVVKELPTKQKRQKEKKKKNAVNKAIQLGEFLESPNVDGYEIPKRDLFYEGLVLQGLAPPLDNSYYSKPANDCYEFPKRDSPPPQENSASSLVEEPVPNENSLSDTVEDGALTTLVLENIPIGTSKDNIASLMADYGELKRISITTNGKSSSSYIKIILEYDVEWIIDCLNGTEPFGASREKLKCYQL